MGIIDDIKSIAKTLQQADNIELYQKILNIQADALDLLEKNNKLQEKNKELKEKLKIKGDLVLEHDAYWMPKKDGSKDGPFCTRCWDVEKNIVRLHPMGNPAYYECPNCKCGSIKAKPELDTIPYHHRTPKDDPF